MRVGRGHKVSPTKLPSILVVDDQPEVRGVLRHILERKGGYAIAEAGGAEEALGIIRSYPPDALLLDISMPGTSGLSVISAVREISTAIKILVLSSHFGMEDEVIALGADAFLPKTSPPKVVLRKLAELLAA